MEPKLRFTQSNQRYAHEEIYPWWCIIGHCDCDAINTHKWWRLIISMTLSVWWIIQTDNVDSTMFLFSYPVSTKCVDSVRWSIQAYAQILGWLNEFILSNYCPAWDTRIHLEVKRLVNIWKGRNNLEQLSVLEFQNYDVICFLRVKYPKNVFSRLRRLQEKPFKWN